MKKAIKIILLLMLTTTGPLAQAQVNLCAGQSTVISALNTLSLSNPSYSLNPGGVTSASPAFTISPPPSLTTYTLYATGTDSNSAIVTTSNTILVSVYGVTYSVASSVILGCGSQSTAIVNIINSDTAPISGGATSFTFLPPGSPATGYTFNAVPTATINSAGTWSVVVRDEFSGCESMSALTAIVNTVAPGIAVSAPTRTLSCNIPSVTLTGSSPNSAFGPVSFIWSFPNGANPVVIPSPILAASLSTTSAFSSTVNHIYTLTVTDLNNGCSTSTVVTVWKNILPPIAAINGANPNGPCMGIQTLADGSSIPTTAFPTPLGTSAILWEGPPPQAPASYTTFYTAQVPGIYTLTVMDLNNGCTSTQTVNVTIKPTAAFVHTITGGQATFNNISINTNSNTTYYWDFGDGNASPLQNPTHTYLNGGAHLVKLILTNPGIFCSDTLVQSVNISGIPCSANSNFSLNPTGTPQVWDVIPYYPWNITAASWDWGDGTTSNTLYTSHQYSAANMYNICLSVTVSCAASSSTCLSYNVYRSSQQAMIIAVNVVAPDLILGVTPANTNSDLSWNILPNPNSGEFRIALEADSIVPARILISDLTGRIVHDQFIEPNSNSVSVNTNNLPSGMYLVTLQSGDLKIIKRMAVNR